MPYRSETPERTVVRNVVHGAIGPKFARAGGPGLRVIDGGGHAQPLTGRAVLGELVDLLEDRLPYVTADDPCRAHLASLLQVLAARQLPPPPHRTG